MQHYARRLLQGAAAPALPPAVTLLGRIFDTTSNNKFANVTPAVGDLLVALVALTGVSTTSVTDDQGGTYTAVASCLKTGSADIMAFYIRDQLVTTTAVHAVQGAGGLCTGGGIAVFKVTNMTATGAAAMRSNGSQGGQAAANTPAPVLSNTPLLKNPVLAAVFIGAASIVTQRTGYTEHFDETYSTPSTAWQCCSRDNGETSATLTYGSSPGTGIWGSVAIELNAP